MDLMAGWGVGDQDRMVQQILEEASAELALPQLGAKPAIATGMSNAWTRDASKEHHSRS